MRITETILRLGKPMYKHSWTTDSLERYLHILDVQGYVLQEASARGLIEEMVFKAPSIGYSLLVTIVYEEGYNDKH